MGPARKAPTFAWNAAWTRNLNKSQLGGVVFGCTANTMAECLTKQLFGLPSQHFVYVNNIEPGLPLFLFNYSERKLHGIYEAASQGKMNIDSYAWTVDGSDRTKYPAQVQVRTRLQCQALDESQFQPIIADNYYSRTHFMFELDHAQANKLMSKFSSLAVAPRSIVQQNPSMWRPLSSPSNNKKEETRASEPPNLTDDSVGTSASSDDSICFDGTNQLRGSNLGHQTLEIGEKDFIYMKLKELALCSDFSGANAMEHAVGASSAVGLGSDNEIYEDGLVTQGKNISGGYSDSFDYPSIIAQLCRKVEDLKTFKLDQTQRVETLERKLTEAEQRIHRLEDRCMTLESLSSTSMRIAGDRMLNESLAEFHLDLNESIFLVGGYDGESWSSALDSFLPSDDALLSLRPMSSVRSYASVAQYNGELYVCGGGTGSMWYDTVESYNPVDNIWTLRPSLNKKNGSLAAAALNGKLFVLGGGNGADCFSDVEMFDPCVGRWISARSMLQKVVYTIA